MSLLPIVYNCYEQGLGLCIIINQKLFYADTNLPNAVELEERSWTDDDRNKLKETFTSFGAECQVFNDLTREELLDKLDDAQQKANNPRYSWVVVWVLSHQRRLQGMDQVFGCNGVGVDRNGIINAFTDTTNCPNMSGKPKLFFFEASPHPATQTEISITDTASSHIHGSDYMVTSFAPCHTNSGENTSYIQRVCSLLTSQGEEADLTDILSLTQAVQCINTMKKKIVLKQPRNSSTDSDIEHDRYSPKADNACTNYTLNTSNSVIPVSPATEELYASGPGLCIIINQELFYADYNIHDATLVDERQATNNDKDNLKKTFGQFGAEFVIFQDLTREELEDRLKAAAVKADSPQYCWVAVCILSHGGDSGDGGHEVYGCNGVGLHTDKIVNTFTAAPNCKTLLSKPKLFFFQACKDTKGGFQTIKGNDYMIAGFVPWRSPLTGSFFISSLCKVLEECGHKEHLGRIIDSVNKQVYSQCLNRLLPNQRDGNPCKPEIEWKLRKKFRFLKTSQ